MTALGLLKKWRAEIADDPEVGLWGPPTIDRFSPSKPVKYGEASKALWDAYAAETPRTLSQASRLRIYDAAIARLEGEPHQ